MKIEEINPFIRFCAIQDLDLVVRAFNGTFKNYVVGLDHRIYYCLSGTGTIKIGKNNYTLSSGDIILWNSGNKYKIFLKKNSPPFKCITINFDYFFNHSNINIPVAPSKITEFTKNKIIEQNILFDDAPIFNNPIYIRNIPEIKENLLEIKDNYDHRTMLSSLKMKRHFFSAISKIIERGSLNKEQSESLITQVKAYIHEHYDENLTNQSIAEYFGYHKNYLSSLFLKESGITLRQYLISYRLDRAHYFLQYSNLKIDDICQKININERQYFNRIYKRTYSETPKETRKNTKNIF